MATATLSVKSCIQCGRCSGGCPVSIKSNLNVRRLVYYSSNDMLGTIDADELGLWECTTCTTCSERCPKNVQPAEIITELRSRVIESGRMSPQIQAALESTYVQGNPWGRAREKRMEWAADLDLPVVEAGAKVDTLLFVCCTAAYDQRCQPVARALVKLLRAAGVDFGVIGEAETCCSSEQRKMGELGMFDELAQGNAKVIMERHPKRVVVLSPHCFNTFKKDYAGLDVPIVHHTQLLAELLAAGKLKVKTPLEEVVTYHDPCYLGKQNKVYEEPRDVLKALAGDRFVELDRSRETSLCCEGGGGRMWVESAGKGRLGETRVLDSIDVGASILATACPFCILTLEDAVKTTNSDSRIRIKDIAELLADSL